MTDQDHLRASHYDLAAKTEGGAGSIARRLLDHLSGLCAHCRRQWLQLGALRDDLLRRMDALPPVSDSERDSHPWELSATPEDIATQRRHTEELRRRRRRGWEEKWRLLKEKPEDRIKTIRRARRQFHSRLVAEALIKDSKAMVRDAPTEAAEIASLVPHVLRWTTQPGGPVWGATLTAEAEGCRANALRVSGDLVGAEKVFTRLREELALRPICDARTVGQLASLEASLCIAQRRFEEAGQFLDQAMFAFRFSGDGSGLAGAEINRAILHQGQGEPEQTLSILERTARRPEVTENFHLRQCVVDWQVCALCDAGRSGAARKLLLTNQELYDSDEIHGGAVYRALRGRIALAEDDLDLAEELFESSRDTFAMAQRTHEAALASLDLSRVYLASGRWDELKELAASLARQFQQSGAKSEELEALKLLRRRAAVIMNSED